MILPQEPGSDTSQGNEPAAPQQDPSSSPKKKVVIVAIVIAILAILGGLFYFMDLGKYFKGMMALPEGMPMPIFANIEETDAKIQGLSLIEGAACKTKTPCGQFISTDQLFYKEFTPTTFDQSVEFWAKVESDGTIMKIKAKDGTELFDLSNSGGILVLKIGETETITSAENAVDGLEWQHFAFVASLAEGVKIYVNGKEEITKPNGVGQPISSNKIMHKLYASTLNFNDPDAIFVATAEGEAGGDPGAVVDPGIAAAPEVVEDPDVVADPGVISDPATDTGDTGTVVDPGVVDPGSGTPPVEPIVDQPPPATLAEIILFGGFTGYIDNVNIYDAALSGDQVKSIYESQEKEIEEEIGEAEGEGEGEKVPCESGPVIYWPFKEGEEIDGTIDGATWENGDLYFPNSATVTIPYSEKLNFGTNDMTISLWVKVKKITSYANVINKSEGSYKSRKGFSYALSPTGWGGNSIFWFQDGDSSPYDPSKPEADSVASAQYSYIWNDTSVLKDKFTPNIDVTDGQWHNVVGVLDREKETIRSYIDGEDRSMPVRSVKGIKTLDNTVDLIFGDKDFDGYIKNVAIFEKVLAPDEIKTLYSQTVDAEYCVVERQEIKNCKYNEKEYEPKDEFEKGDGCNTCVCKKDGTVECSNSYCKKENDIAVCKDKTALYWPLNEGVSNQIADLVEGVKGEITGAKWDDNEKAFYFDGTGDTIKVPNNEAMNFGLSDLTLSAWIKIKKPTWEQWDGDVPQPINQVLVITKREGSYKSRKGFSFELADGWGGNSLFWFQDGNPNPYDPQKPDADSVASAQYAYIWDGKNTNYFKNIDPVKVLDGEWHNVVGTLNRTEGKIKVYIDGNERSIPFGGRTVTGVGSLDNSADLIFGGNNFDGYLRNVVIFKKALTADEIDALYKETKNASYCTVELAEQTKDDKKDDKQNVVTTPASQPTQPVVNQPGGSGGGSKKTVKAPKITPIKVDGTGLLAEDVKSLQMTCLTKDTQSLTYADVGDHWVSSYAKEVSKIKVDDDRILEGYSTEDGKRLLKPDDLITRAEFLKLALGMGCKCTNDTSQTKKFSDVASDHWAYNLVNCAKDNEIVKGNADGGYNPDGAVTRAEALTLLLRARGTKITESTQASVFTDIKKTDWYHDVMIAGESLKLITGYTSEDGSKTFAPNSPITRAEAVSVIYKLL